MAVENGKSLTEAKMKLMSWELGDRTVLEESQTDLKQMFLDSVEIQYACHLSHIDQNPYVNNPHFLWRLFPDHIFWQK